LRPGRTHLGNEGIDQALKHVFFYLHELVQQLNIVKPAIPREFPLIEQYVLDHLDWQEGFADYRTRAKVPARWSSWQLSPTG
jgi:hypothetical protein